MASFHDHRFNRTHALHSLHRVERFALLVDVVLVGHDIGKHEREIQKLVASWPWRSDATQVSFRVTTANKHITDGVCNMIYSYVVTREDVYIELSIVESQLSSHHKRGGDITTLYLIHCPLPAIPLDFSSSRRLYWYGRPDQQCPGVTGISQNRRFAWLDLLAGPSNHGPGITGEGGVHEHSLPDNNSARLDFPAKVAALILRTTRILFAPDLNHLPLRSTNEVSFQLHIILGNEGEYGKAESTNAWDIADKHFDTTSLMQSLEHAVSALPTQRVLWHGPPIVMTPSQCLKCGIALQASRTGKRRSFNKQKQNENFSGNTIHEFLDSKTLRHFMQVPQHLTASGESDKTIVPIYLFVVPSETTRRQPLLLDNTSQAVGFEDMILAVSNLDYRTSETLVVHEIHCGGAPVPVRTGQRGSLIREILASALTSVWGLKPTHLVSKVDSHLYSFDSQETDWLWSCCCTPFGPLAQGLRLYFPQIDNIAKGQVKSHLLSLTNEARSILSHFNLLEVEPDQVLNQKQFKHFSQHWDDMMNELERARMQISHLNSKYAIDHLDAAGRHVKLAHEIVHSNTSTISLKSFFQCDDDASGGTTKNDYFRLLNNRSRFISLPYLFLVLEIIAVALYYFYCCKKNKESRTKKYKKSE